MTISVLYIHHVGTFGGASRSLLELILGFPPGAVSPHLLAPHGNVAELYASHGVPLITTAGIAQFDNTRYGHYRGKRWLLLLRESYYALFTLTAMLRAHRTWRDIDLIHVNDITALLPIVLAKKIFNRPVVVHVRSVLDSDAANWRSRLVAAVIRKYADRLIAIDQTVERSIPAGLACEVVHNSFSPERARDEYESPLEARLKQLPKGELKFAIVGNFLPLKGIYEFVDAAVLCARNGIKAQFIIVGGNTRKLSGFRGLILRQSRFVRDVEADLRNTIATHALKERVHLIEFTNDIQSVYRNIDVICFPSHLNAVGRPVYEAAFSKVPGIVAVENPLPDTMLPRETGLCVRAKDAQSLADAMQYFVERPAEVRRMGESAYALALTNFDRHANAARVLAIYREVLEANSRKRATAAP